MIHDKIRIVYKSGKVVTKQLDGWQYEVSARRGIVAELLCKNRTKLNIKRIEHHQTDTQLRVPTEQQTSIKHVFIPGVASWLDAKTFWVGSEASYLQC